MRAILDAAPTGVLITDMEERVLWLNRTLRRQLDTVQDSVGESLEALPLERVDDLRPGRECYRIRTESSGEPAILEALTMEFDAQDGSRLKLRYLVEVGAAAAGLRASLLQRLEARHGIDPDTGVIEKDAIMRVLDSEVSRSRRYRNPLSVLLLQVRPDLHDAEPGSVMAAAARILIDGLRWVDAAGRISSTEFLLVLPETDADGVVVLANKLRARFSAQHESRSPIAASIATTSWRKADNSSMILLDRARGLLSAHKGLT
jgi:GGDEF domain-containing protein